MLNSVRLFKSFYNSVPTRKLHVPIIICKICISLPITQCIKVSKEGHRIRILGVTQYILTLISMLERVRNSKHLKVNSTQQVGSFSVVQQSIHPRLERSNICFWFPPSLCPLNSAFEKRRASFASFVKKHHQSRVAGPRKTHVSTYLPSLQAIIAQELSFLFKRERTLTENYL